MAEKTNSQMKSFLAAVVWAVSLAAAAAQPPKLTIPPEVRPAGQYVELLPETDAVSVVYVGLSGVEPVPSRWLSDKRAFLLDTRGLPVGRYSMIAVGASKTGEQAKVAFVIVIGEAPPIPPGPTPPPVPPPTPPSDPFVKDLQAAYTAITDADKAALLGKLSAFYEASALLAMDTSTATYGQLYAKMTEKAKELGSYQKLGAVQEVIRKRLVAELPYGPEDQIGTKRDSAAALFREIARALKGVQ